MEPELSTTAFLATVPLLAGIPETDLTELAGLLRHRDLAPGAVLWRQGDEAQTMVLIARGRVSLSLHLPGDRTLEFTSIGPGEVLGEVPLFDGGHHTATALVTESAHLLLLGRADFAALLARRTPSAFALKRRIAAVACGRLRMRLATLAASLRDGGGGAGPARPAEVDLGALEPCRPPNSGYLRRLGTFRSFDSLALWSFLTAGRYAICPPGRTLVAEGTSSATCYLTMNGAVEKLIIRGDRRVRVGLAGPGQAFGYESLIDGGQAPLTAVTRERSLLLALPREAFDWLFNGDAAGSHVFLDVINRDLMAALRQVHRPQARLALRASRG